jgi:PAT family beta-lactamase induction signal transducer AmpG
MKSPWRFIPTLYLAEGLPYVLINAVSVVFYKRMGVDNTQIALWTSFLYLPWVVKMFWGPVVDIYSTRRNWILYTQWTMGLFLAGVSLMVHLPLFFFLTLAVFVAAAFVSATHDIAVDGFYLLALEKEEQAFFVGVRSFFYRVAMIVGSGLLVFFAGKLENTTHQIPLSWSITFGLVAVAMAVLASYHKFFLPFPEDDIPRKHSSSETQGKFLSIFKEYFKQDKIIGILGFILLYRLGEAMLVKMASPFLLDSKETGGLGLSTSDVGLVYGTAGVLSLMVGGFLGGWMISKFGLKKCIWPLALALNLPDIFYIYLAYAQPSIFWVYFFVCLEQLGYGLGFAAFMVFLMSVCKGNFKTSHFAISTGFMALGMMLPGMASGFIQKALGYPLFFVTVCLVTIPGMLAIFFIPLEDTHEPVSEV